MIETPKRTRRNVKNDSLNSMNEFGRLLPQALELEEAVLGALMLERNALTVVVEFLQPSMFYKPGHSFIYEAIIELFEKTQPVDILTVTNTLRTNNTLEIAGGAYYITSLTNRVASAANIEYHARIIVQKFILRELIRVSTEIQHDAFEDNSDVFELMDKAESNLFAITESNIKRDFSSMQSLVAESIKQIEAAQKNTDGISGIPSGFTDIDRVTAGWQKSDLIIIAARPGMGKTAFVLSLARNVAVRFARPIAIFTLEMSSIQLVNRLISMESEIPAEKLKRGNLEDYEWQQLNSKINQLTEAPIFIDDTPSLNIFELRAKCRRLKAQYDIQMVVIDYLQLMTAGGDGKNGNREQEISSISRSLKSIAKELDIPIIALSQLNRQVDSRSGSKKPVLSDLRESGAIEQDADMVCFIYRPEYYQLEVDEDNVPTKNMAKFIIAKHRNGSLEDINLKFANHLARFSDWDMNSNDNFNEAYHTLSSNSNFDGEQPSIKVMSRMHIDENEAPY
jgi:replicative DNA helicase